MKAKLLALLTIATLAIPAISRAQYYHDPDTQNYYEYRDVDDGQLLKLFSYILMPMGMGLEWGLMRPLHYAATQTAAAPLLSGDKDVYQFGQNNNSDLVPPGTFAPPPLNLSNIFVPSPPEPTHPHAPAWKNSNNSTIAHEQPAPQ
jgi:hypothetical protein